MAFSGRSSLERTNGRPLCPQCRAPMWSVRAVSIHTMCAFPPLSCALHMSAFDPKRTSPVNSTTLHPLDRRTDKDCLTSRIFRPQRRSEQNKAETEPKTFIRLPW